MSLNSLDWHGIWHKDASIQQLLQRYKKRVNRVNRGTSFKALRSSISSTKCCLKCSFCWNMGMDQYLLIPFLGEWTSIYQLYVSHCHMSHMGWFYLVEIETSQTRSTGFRAFFHPGYTLAVSRSARSLSGTRTWQQGPRGCCSMYFYVSMDLQSCQINLNV